MNCITLRKIKLLNRSSLRSLTVSSKQLAGHGPAKPGEKIVFDYDDPTIPPV